MSFVSSEVGVKLARVRDAMERAAVRAGRSGEEITLIAVSKTHSAAQVRELYEAGVSHFGENRVQEWESKYQFMKDIDATWHMIGHVQGNKVARAVRLFHTIDTIDTAALAERLDRAKGEFRMEGPDAAERRGELDDKARESRLPVLIEVKLDPNAAKSGVSGEELPRLVETVLPLCHLELRGLMGVPPYFDDPENARPYFRRLRDLREAIRVQMGTKLLPVLSMGMSHDFEIAIEEGATEIRIGTALFGIRKVE